MNYWYHRNPFDCDETCDPELCRLLSSQLRHNPFDCDETCDPELCRLVNADLRHNPFDCDETCDPELCHLVNADLRHNPFDCDETCDPELCHLVNADLRHNPYGEIDSAPERIGFEPIKNKLQFLAKEATSSGLETYLEDVLADLTVMIGTTGRKRVSPAFKYYYLSDAEFAGWTREDLITLRNLVSDLRQTRYQRSREQLWSCIKCKSSNTHPDLTYCPDCGHKFDY